jgi:hypothetical protein
MSLDKIARKNHIKILFKFIQIFIEYMSKKMLLKKKLHILEIRPEGPTCSAYFGPAARPAPSCAQQRAQPAANLA